VNLSKKLTQTKDVEYFIENIQRFYEKKFHRNRQRYLCQTARRKKAGVLF
jgi:hypothetical protein